VSDILQSRIFGKLPYNHLANRVKLPQIPFSRSRPSCFSKQIKGSP
jgi:hypothetical protein